MRPTKRNQDPLIAPLNELLGSEGNIRVLRVLAATTEPMGRATIARRAELDPSGVRRILERFARRGLIETVGSGRNQASYLRARHPVATPIRQLFREERSAHERILEAIRAGVESMPGSVDAVWIENPAARAPGIIDIGVLASPRTVDEASRELSERLGALGQEIGMQFVVHPYTDAEVDLLNDTEDGERLSNVTLVSGWIPVRWRSAEGGPIRSHRELDARASRLAAAIAKRLPNDPAILESARRWLEKQLDSSGSRHSGVLNQWRRILERLSVGQIQALLTEDSERARELRQSLPFAEVLSAKERAALMQQEGDE